LKVTSAASVGTVTPDGMLAALVFERVSVSEVPLGAGPLRVIVPFDVAPPAICCGEKAKLVGAGGCTVSVVVCWTPWLEAVMVTEVELLTGSVFT